MYTVFDEKNKQNKGLPMRETRTVQTSIFDFYSKHEFGSQLENLSDLLDEHPEILSLVAADLKDASCNNSGRHGLSIESIFRCLLLKQILQISYEKLAFYLSDSLTYRTFTRLKVKESPRKSVLQSTIRQIKPETLEAVYYELATSAFDAGECYADVLRIDSTVVKSNIATPSDSQLLDDAVRVMSRCLAKSAANTDVKIRFKDNRKKSKALARCIFYAKNKEKAVLYPKLLRVVKRLTKQVDRAIARVQGSATTSDRCDTWLKNLMHYRALTEKIIDQAERRVIKKEMVPSTEKIVSLFESHTDIIIKGNRDIDFGHKINLATDTRGLVTGFTIEMGNPSDTERYLPMLEGHERLYGELPNTVVADGGYASQANVKAGKALGVKRVVFHKKKGITLKAMGVQQKTYDKLKGFRAGIEGNISELKRAFGLGKVTWKGQDGFGAYVFSSIISYNLMRLARFDTG